MSKIEEHKDKNDIILMRLPWYLWKKRQSPGLVSAVTGSPSSLVTAASLAASTVARSPARPWLSRPSLCDPGTSCRHPFSLSQSHF